MLHSVSMPNMNGKHKSAESKEEEELLGGPLTTAEYILLENILVYCEEEDI